MYIVELCFECYRDTSLGEAERAIVNYLDMLRYQGQILGREFPTSMHEGYFVSRVVCPEQDSLHPDNQSDQVKLAEQQLNQAGLLAPKLQLQGADLLSDSTDPCGQQGERPSWMMLYTSFLHTCSPLRCGDHFAPSRFIRCRPSPTAIRSRSSSGRRIGRRAISCR